MSVNVIPTAVDAYYTEVVTLEGTDYLLQMDYSLRENCYYLSISTPDGDDIVNGIKVVSSWPLLHRFTDPRLPPGEIIACPNTSTTDPAPSLGQILPLNAPAASGTNQTVTTNAPWTLIYFSSNQLWAGGGQPASALPTNT
jgi:uncharacterized protein DUF6983